MARKHENAYLATLGNVHWVAYPFLKTLRRVLEVAGCKKVHDPFMEAALNEISGIDNE